jgi:hypothetical protein
MGWIAIASIAALSCETREATMEERIRAFLGEMERAVEAGDVGPLERAIAEDYADPNGNDRDAIIGILTYHFLRNREIHLLTRIGTVEVAGKQGASVIAHVAMAGQPIPDAGALAGLRADLYRFDFSLADDGEGSFELFRAVWRPAGGEDFF